MRSWWKPGKAGGWRQAQQGLGPHNLTCPCTVGVACAALLSDLAALHSAP